MTEPESTEPEGATDPSTESAGDDQADDAPGADAGVSVPGGEEAAGDGDHSGEAAAGEETVPEGIEDVVDGERIEQVREASPEELAREIATLELEIDGLQAELETRDGEIEELTSKLKRKQADFENYKKRMQRRREDEKRRATEGLLQRFLPVRDNLQRALEQDEDADIRDGVASTLRQLDDVLEAEDVTPIEPDPGTVVDPHRHEVLARVEADVPAGTVAAVHRPGYALADAILREAQVTVAEETSDGGGEPTDGETATDTTDADAGGSGHVDDEREDAGDAA